MGSGCNNNVSSKAACVTVISSDCAIYSGDSVPLLGICCGDTVTEVEKAIIDKLLEVLQGTGITLESVTLENCTYLKTLFGNKSKTLVNLVQLLVDSDCTLRALIKKLEDQLLQTGSNFQFDLKCLDDSCCPSNVTRDQIMQMLIDKVCELETIINEIQSSTGGINTTINNVVGNFLNTAINTCSNTGIKKTGTGADTRILLVGMPPPESYIPYFGPLQYFDASGKGIDGTPACGWYIANGQNGTIDMRGYTFAGATEGVGSNPLDARVDPAILNQPTAAAGYKTKKGEVFNTLTVQQMPSHTHILTDPGHSHTYTYPTPEKFSGNKFDSANRQNTETRTTSVATTGITIGNTGSNQPHNNVQPTVYGVWITRFD